MGTFIKIAIAFLTIIPHTCVLVAEIFEGNAHLNIHDNEKIIVKM